LRLRLSLLMFLQWAVPGALLPLYSYHLKDGLGFDEMQTAACCATQAAAAVVASLVAGQVADRWFSAERCLTVCSLLAGADLWLLAELRGPTAVFLATLLFWLLAGPLTLLGTTISLTRLAAPHRQFAGVRLWGTAGWMVTGWLIGYGLANPPWLLEALAWLRPGAPRAVLPDAFRLGGLLAFVLAGYALTLPPTLPWKATAAPRALAPLAALKRLRGWRFATYSVCMLGACVTFPFTTQNTPLLLSQLGIPPAWLQPTLTLAQFSEIVSLALLPLLLLRLGLRGTMLLGLAAWALALAVLSTGGPLQLVVASQGLNGLFVAGFLVAGQVFLNGQAEGDLRTSIQGLFGFVNGLGLLIGNLLAGWLRQAAGGDLSQTFAVGAAITAGLLLVFLLGFREQAVRA
jgi:MFS family permease